jgi:hypothetical protein
VTILGDRWKYKDAFEYCNAKLPGEISIIANGDIYFDQSLINLHLSSMRGKFLAITRHETEILSFILFIEVMNFWFFVSFRFV